MNQNLDRPLLYKWCSIEGKENEKSKMAEIICRNLRMGDY